MPKTTKNVGLLTDMDAKKHHVEVGEYKFVKKSKTRIFFENVAHTAARSSRAVDDSYGIFSSIAGVGFSILKVPFIVLGFFLSIGYSIASYYKRNRSDIELTNESFDKYAEDTITKAHFQTWDRKLNYIQPVLGAPINPEVYNINIESLVRKSKSTDMLEHIKKALERIADKKKLFKKYKTNIHNETLRIKLSLLNDRIKLLRARLIHNLKHTAKTVNDKKLNAEIIMLYDPDSTKNEKQKNAKYALQKAWSWFLDNYQRILTGITIAATFASLTVLLFGTALLTLFPWNIIIALGLVVVVTSGDLAYKLWFEKIFKGIIKTERNLKNSIKDKRTLSSQFVETIVLESKIEHAIFDYKIARVALEGPEPLKSEADHDEKSANDYEAEAAKLEHSELQQLRNESSKSRRVLLFIIPTLLAFNAGYSIGATLLQLAVIAGIAAPVLPFIILGASFAVIYVAHKLYSCIQQYKDEDETLNNLNTDVITNDKIRSGRNALRLLNIKSIKMDDRLVSYDEFVKKTTSNDIANRIAAILKRIEKLKEQVGNLGVKIVYRHLINVLSAEVNTIKSEDLKEKLVSAIGSPNNVQKNKPDVPAEAKKTKSPTNTQKSEPVEPVEVGKNKPPTNAFFSWLYKAYRFVAHYLKPIAQGATFGLSMGASLIIFLIGASSLVTLPVSIGILVGGGVFGISVSLANKILKDNTAVFTKKINATIDQLHDKDRMLDMYVEAEQALWKANKVDGALSGNSSREASPKPQRKKKIQRSLSMSDLSKFVAESRDTILKTSRETSNSKRNLLRKTDSPIELMKLQL